MSTKLITPGEKSSETENPAASSVSTSESCQPVMTDAQPKPTAGKASTSVMTADELGDLLARLQDILSLWPGSDNRIVNGYVMTALPVPADMTVDKVMTSHGKAFAVNGVPVIGA